MTTEPTMGLDPNYTPTPPNILQRLNAVMKEVDYIQKEKKAGMRYSIVSHDSVTAKVRPLMVKHGIVYWPTMFQLDQVGNRTQLKCAVVFANVDDRRDFIHVYSAGYGIDEQDKGPGKAISYAVKYALLKVLGLETGDEPDEDQDSTTKPDKNDLNRAYVEEFKVAVGKATSMDVLNDLREQIKPVLATLNKDFPAYVQSAQQIWQQKAREISK